jgi:hypothetical protein
VDREGEASLAREEERWGATMKRTFARKRSSAKAEE